MTRNAQQMWQLFNGYERTNNIKTINRHINLLKCTPSNKFLSIESKFGPVKVQQYLKKRRRMTSDFLKIKRDILNGQNLMNNRFTKFETNYSGSQKGQNLKISLLNLFTCPNLLQKRINKQDKELHNYIVSNFKKKLNNANTKTKLLQLKNDISNTVKSKENSINIEVLIKMRMLIANKLVKLN